MSLTNPNTAITEKDLQDFYNMIKPYLNNAPDLSPYALKSELPTNLSDLSDDSTHRLVTDTEKRNWDKNPYISRKAILYTYGSNHTNLNLAYFERKTIINSDITNKQCRVLFDMARDTGSVIKCGFLFVYQNYIYGASESVNKGVSIYPFMMYENGTNNTAGKLYNAISTGDIEIESMIYEENTGYYFDITFKEQPARNVNIDLLLCG